MFPDVPPNPAATESAVSTAQKENLREHQRGLSGMKNQPVGAQMTPWSKAVMTMSRFADEEAEAGYS